MRPSFALIGNPNAGKTTLFNALTGDSLRVGNWPGVTVEKKEGVFTVDGREITLVDLPGAYSLTPLSVEERVTSEFVSSGGADVMINAADISCLQRSLVLTQELINAGRKTVLALNMADEFTKAGGRIDVNALSGALGIPVVFISAKRKTGLDKLCLTAAQMLSEPPAPNRKPAEDLHASIEKALTAAGYAPPERLGTRKIDRLLIGKYSAFPILAAVLALVFYLAFGAPGRMLTSAINAFFALLLSAAAEPLSFLPMWAQSLVINGICSGVFGVLVFLPQVMILYFFMAVIEDSGYMARAAFITDRLFKRLGLSGRSMIPLIMAFGCTTTAAASARSVENERDRQLTAMMTPFVSCGAKMPVYALIASEMFPGLQPVVILGLYALGFLVLALAGSFFNRFMLPGADSPFILELPAYRMPDLRSVTRRTMRRAQDFARRAGTVILLASAVSWFLTYFSSSLAPAASGEDSLLFALASVFSPIFRPLGFSSPYAVSALFSGAFAKESILSCLRVFAPDSLAGVFQPSGALAYLVFILIGPPCLSALAAIAKEVRNRKLMGELICVQLLLAYAFSFLFYHISALFL